MYCYKLLSSTMYAEHGIAANHSTHCFQAPVHDLHAFILVNAPPHLTGLQICCALNLYAQTNPGMCVSGSL